MAAMAVVLDVERSSRRYAILGYFRYGKKSKTAAMMS